MVKHEYPTVYMALPSFQPDIFLYSGEDFRFSGGEVAQWRRRGGSMEEERWLNGSTTDCKSVILGSNPAPLQYMANSISPEVGSHLG
jgi:hypothetical protein